FPVEGDESAARFVVNAYFEGWRNILLYNLRGHRFIGAGLGPRTNGLRIDCYGDVGDYVASGIDGCELTVHGAAQDQAAQILKYGKLAVHGDVGQAFMYAAKGGDVYVLGNAAGRPQINGVRLADFTTKDWELILPYLKENARLFGISVEQDLLTVDGKLLGPSQIYRKIEPISLQELT